MVITLPLNNRNVGELLNKVKQHLTLTGDDKAGIFTGKVEGAYQVGEKDIMITVTKKPFYVTEGLLTKTLREALA